MQPDIFRADLRCYSGFVHKIESLSAAQIADSRGNPTIEVTLTTQSGQGVVSVPSGASVGAHEAKVVEPAIAITQINTEVKVALAGKEFDQKSLDAFLIQLDGTPDKSRLGGNATLGVSLAFARAAAAEQKAQLYQYLGTLAGVTAFALPVPMFNVINGGKHAHDGIAVQEFMLVPVGIATTAKRVEAALACMNVLKQHLIKNGLGTELGDEGGFAPHLRGSEEALLFLAQSITDAGFSKDDIRISIDVAASGLLQPDGYHEDGKVLSSAELLSWYKKIADQYNLFSIEDPFAEDDWSDFHTEVEQLTALIVGDDLTVTNTDRIALAVQKKAIDAVIIKPNQVGTVTETIAAVAAAHTQGWKAIASHRSGETPDTWIADVAVGLGCSFIKAGAPTRPERTAKYDRLMEIESQLS